MIEDYPFQEEIQEYRKDLRETHFYSRFLFIKSHYGFRPGNLHGILGTIGSGKSSLFKSLIYDTAKHDPCLVWLSEEKTIEYVNKFKLIGDERSISKNVKFVREKDLDFKNKSNLNEVYEKLEEKIFESNCKVIFIDNVTTGCIYSDEMGYQNQIKSAGMLQNLCKGLNIPIVYLAHTSANVRDNSKELMTSESIKGSKSLTTVTEYLYGMHKITSSSDQFNFVKIIKHRHHDVQEKTVILNWENGHYRDDAVISYKELQDLFEKRDRLK